MDENSFDKKYIETLSTLGKNLFRDFLSELSRKRQFLLLSTSIITILISFTVITPTETSLLGIKFSFTNNQALPLLSGAFSLYFLLIYTASVFQDLQYFEYIEAPLQYEYAQVIMQVQDTQMSQDTLLFNLSRDIMKQMTTSFDVNKEMNDKAEQFKQETVAAIAEMEQQGKSDDEIEKFTAERIKQFKERVSEYGSYVEQEKHRSDLMGQKMTDGINKGKVLLEKLEFFTKTYVQTYNRFKFWRNIIIFIEIVFPIGIGISAVGIAVWAIL